MSLDLGTIVARREPIRADDLNSLIRALRQALTVRCGAGLSATWSSSGLSISLDNRQIVSDMVDARIVSVTGDNPDLPANIRYTVEAVGNPGCTLIDVLPSGGRPVKGSDTAFTKLRPAAVGSRCWILQDRDAAGVITPKLLLWPGGTDGECVFFEQCASS